MARFHRNDRSYLKAQVFATILVLSVVQASESFAQLLVEYPNQNRTYGDHTLNSNWDGVDVGLTVSFDSDDVTLHEDGVGISQRTARNTQTFTEPVGPDNPQNYDNDFLVETYGPRLPLIQQMSANGTSVFTYAFDEPLDFRVDLFVTDVDRSDRVSVTAFDSENNSLDMTQWTLIDEGDLSTYKDTGSAFSETVAPVPTTVFETGLISLEAVDGINYNRSYSIFRSPIGAEISRIEITFVGFTNSPTRSSPSTGAHIYLALATVPFSVGDFNRDGAVDITDIDFYSGNLGQPVSFDPQLDMEGDGDIDADDLNFHIETYVQTSNGQIGTLVGDMNLDGQVDVLGDAFTLIANLGLAGPYSYGLGDLNADLAIDVLGDAFILISNLGQSNLP